jgi:microcystin-dependent protein
MSRRHYNNTSVPTNLTANATAGATSLQVASTAGFPAVPFTIGIERGTANEEVCLVTAIPDGTHFTVTRGYDGTTGKSHTAPTAAIEHCVISMDYDEANAHVNDAALHQGAPTGVILPWAGTEAAVPAGWLMCYGQAVSRATYSALHTLLKDVGGTNAYGWGAGDGATTFNMPDFRGRVPIGRDNMGGASANRVVAAAADTLGGTGGAETVTLTSAEMPSHTHVQDPHTHVQNAHTHTQNAHAHGYGDSTQSSVTQAPAFSVGIVIGSGNNLYSTTSVAATNQNATATNQNTTATNQATGGGGAHQNMPPYAALTYIIKT